ncbi:MAG: MotA/TolQ/ExbB proton channel family protein [bacterium]|nr:MotA/TolQ/ExbB proton channel family protein [bacterium]
MNPTTWWWNVSMVVRAAVGQSTTGEAPSSVQVQSVWDFLIKGGPMMIPIGLCSLAALAVVVERVFSLRRGNVIPSGFIDALRSLLEGGEDEREHALAYCRENESPIANIILAGLKHQESSASRRDRHIQEAGEHEVFKLRKYLRMLSVVAALAPVMGLLGTVFGMINAFQTVAVSAEALGKTELLARGIYEALITTAAGLLLAIPVLIAYHWLTSHIERLVYDMDRVVSELFEQHAPSAPDTAGVGPRLAGSTSEDSEQPGEEVAAAPA